MLQSAIRDLQSAIHLRPAKLTRFHYQAVGLAALVLAMASMAAADAPADRLKAAKEAAKKAAAVEEAANKEWNSREMARSAAREIAVSARNTTERALQNLVAAQETVKEKQAAGKAAEVAAWEKKVKDRLGTLRAAADRMVNDQRVANMTTEDLIVIEKNLATKMQLSRAAERVALVLEAEVAQSAADKAVAEKAANAKELATKAKAAQRAIKDLDVVAALEAQAWLGVHRSTYQQMAGGHAQAIEIAKGLLASDTDGQRHKIHQNFMATVTAQKTANDKKADDLTQAMQAMDWKIYALGNAALGGLKLIDHTSWDYAKARHLLVRAGFGGTPQEVAKLKDLGPLRAAESLVYFHRQPAAKANFDAAPPSRPDPIENQVRNGFVRSQVANLRRGNVGPQAGGLRLWWLKRLVESPRPLQEKLALFWHGHFATQYSVVQNSYTTYHQNQLFREHAAGNFGGLLFGLVHDPVMIRYLDNNTNVKGHANENLAREILELFAMGVDQGYTEKDIREAARALTGYTLDHLTGQFRYLAKNHDEKPKTVFGKTGNWSGDDLVTLILDQPATSRFVAKKLFEYFAYLDPAAAVVEPLADVLRAQSYELSPMLLNLFLSEAFYSDKAVGTQIKGPVQLVAGLLRDLGVKEVTDYGPLDGGIRAMGQDLLEPPDVKGWRGGRAWISSNRIFVRYNTVAELIRNLARPNNQRGIDVVALLDKNICKTETEVVDFLARACFAKPLNQQKRSELVNYLGTLPPPAQWAAQRQQINNRLQELLVLMLCTPEYQMS